VGGILTMPSFQKDFQYTKTERVNVNSNAVSMLQAGAFFGCFGIWPIASRYGRRWSLVVASVIFELGAVLQIVNSHSIICFYVGRAVSGLGVGAATVLVPIYAAEMSPREIRGRFGCLFQLFFATGACVSYWVNYGVNTRVEAVTMQWQIPLALQLIPGGMVGLGMLLIKESARWLAKVGRIDEGLASLVWVRGGVETREVTAEFAEILQGIREEIHATDGFTARELMLPANRYRLMIAVTMQLCQQLTGNSSLAYYAPQIFAAVGAGRANLLVTGFFGLVKIVAVFCFQMLLVERIGRKWAFMGGAAVSKEPFAFSRRRCRRAVQDRADRVGHGSLHAHHRRLGGDTPVRPRRIDHQPVRRCGHYRCVPRGHVVQLLLGARFMVTLPSTLAADTETVRLTRVYQAVSGRDLPVSHPRDRRRNRSRIAVAVQLHDGPDRTSAPAQSLSLFPPNTRWS
jgi:MFS family permease